MKFKTLLVVMGLIPLVGCGSASNETSQEIINSELPNIEIPELEPSTGVDKSMLHWQFFPTDNPYAGDLTILTATISENVISMNMMYDSEGYIAILEGSDVNEDQQIIRNVRFKRYQDGFSNIRMLADRNALDGTITFDLSGDTPSVSFDLVSEKDGVEIKKTSGSSWAGSLNEGLPVTLDALDTYSKDSDGDFAYYGDGKFTFYDDTTGCSVSGVARETSYLTMSKDNFYLSGSGHIFDFSILQENSNCDVGEEGKAGTIDISFSERYTDIYIHAPLHNYNVTYQGQVTVDSDGDNIEETNITTFSTEWLDGRTLYSIYPEYSGASSWGVSIFEYTTSQFSAETLGHEGDPVYSSLETDYQINSSGNMTWFSDGIPVELKIQSSENEYLDTCYVINGGCYPDLELMFYDLETAQEYILNHPL